MLRVLLVSNQHRADGQLAALIRGAGELTPVCAADGAEALEMLEEDRFSLAVIDAETPGIELATLLSRAAETAGVIILVNRERMAELAEAAAPHSALILESPAMGPVLVQALKFAVASRKQIALLYERSVRLQGKLDEAQLVSRAKIALVQYLNMSEQQAHRYIEKQAMNLRITRTEVARNILKNYSPPPI